jgi:hypothetical protein
MSLNNYPLNIAADNFYWFISSGSAADVPKGVFFDPADIPSIPRVYNVGLADYIQEKWTDQNRTNNGDMAKVMETVAAAIVQYLQRFPDRRIYVRGNTEPKRRLYQRYASNNLNEISIKYYLFGKEYDKNQFEVFGKGKVYEALLVEVK